MKYGMLKYSHMGSETPYSTDNNEREKIFKASPYIYKDDGWLSPTGIFWGCGSDEHDACARYILNEKNPGALHELTNSDTETSTYSTVRSALFAKRYAQLAHRTLIAPDRLLTDKQVQKLDAAKIKIPITLSDPSLLCKFPGMNEALNSGLITNTVRDLIRRFVENEMRYSIDDAPAKGDILFEWLTMGFKNGGQFRAQEGWCEVRTFRYPPDASFAVELNQYKHDGYEGNGITYTSTVRVVPIDTMTDYTGVEPDKIY